jgi:hypothetical protein
MSLYNPSASIRVRVAAIASARRQDPRHLAGWPPTHSGGEHATARRADPIPESDFRRGPSRKPRRISSARANVTSLVGISRPPCSHVPAEVPSDNKVQLVLSDWQGRQAVIAMVSPPKPDECCEHATARRADPIPETSIGWRGAPPAIHRRTCSLIPHYKSRGWDRARYCGVRDLRKSRPPIRIRAECLGERPKLIIRPFRTISLAARRSFRRALGYCPRTWL